MADFERVSDDELEALTKSACLTRANAARELIAQRAAAKYRFHSLECLAKVCRADWKCTCGFDALPEYLKGGE